MSHDYISGLSILGGEPLEPQNQEALVNLVKKVKQKYCFCFNNANNLINLFRYFNKYNRRQVWYQ